jgi:hypothetical protein
MPLMVILQNTLIKLEVTFIWEAIVAFKQNDTGIF